MKLVRVAIFLTGITGLAMGGMMSLSSLRSGQEEAILRTNESLKAQATQFVDQYFGVIEASKNITPATTAVPSYITYRAVAKIDKNAPTEFETFTSTDPNADAAKAAADFGMQERVMTSVKAISLPELQISHIAMGTFALSDVGNKEGIYLATPIFKSTNGIVDPNTIEKINVVLIDPTKAFGGLQKISTAHDASAYLISKKGKVLAHTLSAYVGTDLRQIDILKTSIDTLFLGAQTGTTLKYKNVDGEEQQVAFVRAGVSPFAFAVEQRAHPAVLSGAWMSEQVESGAARRSIGFMFVIIATSLVAFSGISVWASRQVKNQIADNARSREEYEPMDSNTHNTEIPMAEGYSIPPNAPISSKIAPSILQSQKSEASNSAQANPNGARNIPQTNIAAPNAIAETAATLKKVRDQIAMEQEQMSAAVQGLDSPRDYLKDFVSTIEQCYALEGVEKELVQVSSEISESPVLYFRYHRRNQSLTLSAVAGDVKIQNYSTMQAYVRKDIELQVEQMADSGKVASISNYGPMSKLIISHLNVAHFEAWGVTSHPEVSGQSKLVGVLVVLQAGIQSAQARPLLARILKSAGNYLYAQSNKIRPRSSHYQMDRNLTIDDKTELS